MKPVDMLINLQYLQKLYKKLSNPVCEKYRLTQMELDIIAFLANNPDYDTAKDIVEIRMLTKSHVSLSLDSLEKVDLLEKHLDKSDKRIVHLKLKDSCVPIIDDIRRMQQQFTNVLMKGISQDDIDSFFNTVCTIYSNAKEAAK